MMKGLRVRALTLLIGGLGLGWIPAAVLGQAPAAIQLEREDGRVEALAVASERGYAVLPLSAFRSLGWSVARSGDEVTLRVETRAEVDLTVGTPFFRWDGVVLQLADPVFRSGDEIYVPAQLVTDFFPERIPEYYDYDTATGRLRAGDPSPRGAAARAARPGRDGGEEGPEEGGTETTSTNLSAPLEVDPPPRSTYDGARVVWVDAGHGGADPGAVGHGVLEKDVALGVARRLAEILRRESSVEVRMTRDEDDFVDLWDRGLLATDAKGERPGVFISIHANSFPARSTTRGFETYFLSEARTDDERRVSANENAPLSIRGRGLDASRQSDLDFILRELRNFDHAHWSALLAQFVQDELDAFHPGPNRGVKQAPLAVLTNAIMPSVLVEVGFVTNSDEARLLARTDFQQRTAEGIAAAVLSFLERYPPGNGLGSR
jgi:N-acetylmuramoyl-L-alanine amidase